MTFPIKCIGVILVLGVAGCEGDPAATDSKGRHISAVGGTVDGHSTELVGGASTATPSRSRTYVKPGETIGLSPKAGAPSNGGTVVSNSVP